MKKIVTIVLIALSFIIFATPIIAASSGFLPQATRYYQLICTKKRVPLAASINCYLFDKVSELQEENDLQGEKIAELEERITILEATPTPTPYVSPCPVAGCEHTFMNWQIPNDGVTSSASDSSLFMNFDIAYYCQYAAELKFEYSDDQVVWIPQIIASPSECKTPGQGFNALPVLGDHYRVVVGPITEQINPGDHQFVFAQARYH